MWSLLMRAIDLIFRLPFCAMHFLRGSKSFPPIAHLTVTHKTDFAHYFYIRPILGKFIKLILGFIWKLKKNCTLHITFT